MEDLRKVLYTAADDAIEMTQDTLNLCPDTCLSECFPYMSCKIVTIDGFDYQVWYSIKLKPIG